MGIEALVKTKVAGVSTFGFYAGCALSAALTASAVIFRQALKTSRAIFAYP
jgi:hypothetical protein